MLDSTKDILFLEVLSGYLADYCEELANESLVNRLIQKVPSFRTAARGLDIFVCCIALIIDIHAGMFGFTHKLILIGLKKQIQDSPVLSLACDKIREIDIETSEFFFKQLDLEGTLLLLVALPKFI